MVKSNALTKSEQSRVLKVLEQTGTRVSIPRDLSRKAMPSGKRMSKAGNIYWETRKNRSDTLLTDL